MKEWSRAECRFHILRLQPRILAFLFLPLQLIQFNLFCILLDGGSAGGFSLACEDFWLNVRQLNPRLHFFFFKVEISSCTQIPILMPGSVHSGSVS